MKLVRSRRVVRNVDITLTCGNLAIIRHKGYDTPNH